ITALTREGERECTREACSRGQRGEGFLPVAPGEGLQRPQPQPPGEVGGEQEDESPFSHLHQRLLAPGEHGVQPRLAFEHRAECVEVKRQEYGERQPRDAMDEEGPIRRMVAAGPHAYTAHTPRRPRTMSRIAKAVTASSAPR